ncbi:MAG TPA: molybdenum cofactor guanylyltransferase [Syntrophomonas sp.]|nr:molybdenum cofactor guanylyltransferase [Syntrophomonas sp.]HRW11716.1 molybdenum cofactor guanylyltransferase [Syntrophomonas sp.]
MHCSGAILAGGKSTRMKFNKAFAVIADKSVYQIIVEKFQQSFEDILTISNEPNLYRQMGTRVCEDVYPGLGPVAGIHSALYHACFDAVFVMGCDMPFMNMELVAYMLAQLGDYDGVVPQIDGKLQPLSAIYSKKCLPVLTDCLQNDRLKLIRVFEELNAKTIAEQELCQFGNIREIFMNVNDRDQLSLARNIAGRYL